MDFIIGIPWTEKKLDAVWVIVDRSQVGSFHYSGTYSSGQLAHVYICEIVRLHGVSVSIISDRGTQFTSRFWKFVQRELGPWVDLRITFYPQTDGQSERTIYKW